MDIKVWQSTLMCLWKERNRYGMAMISLGVINVIQTVTIVLLANHWHTVLVPPALTQVSWINQSSVSDEYLAAMTEYFATLILDVTPENAAFQRDTLLKYVDTENYGAMKTQLIAREDKMKSQNSALSFYPVEIKTDEKKLSALATGDVKTFVGQELTSTLRQSYLARYSYHHGRLLLRSFQEVKKDEAIH